MVAEHTGRQRMMRSWVSSNALLQCKQGAHADRLHTYDRVRQGEEDTSQTPPLPHHCCDRVT